MLDDGKQVPEDSPEEVKQAAAAFPRQPTFDPTLGVALHNEWKGRPPNRLVVIGDSLSHGFQSGAVFNTDLSYPAIIAYELGWLDHYRFPRYPAYGGLPLNIEVLLRDLEQRFGSKLSAWEVPGALFHGRHLMDEIEDYWERGPGATPPSISAYNHDLAVYGWDLRDVLARSADTCLAMIDTPKDDVLMQVVQNNGERAALRVYPNWDGARDQTLLQAAAVMSGEHDADTDCGIETLVVFLGANNALRSVTDLKVNWSGDGYDDVQAKRKYTVWRPEHFRSELDLLVGEVKKIDARHVIWCTVPHVTIAPIARGIGGKLHPGSKYFPYYARPWVNDGDFDPKHDQHITGQEARAVDSAIDLYNADIERAVRDARSGTDGKPRDWYLLDIAGLLDRLASRRYIADPNARPPWWTPYPLPASLKALSPVPDSLFLTSDGEGGRATGGLFSLDGVHPTTVAYGVIAQEMINIMRLAGVEFFHPNNEETPRQDPVTVDFERLIRRDSLIQRPPQNINSTLDILGWANATLDWVKRAVVLGG